MNAAVEHLIQARKVQFDLTQSPIYWAETPFVTHVINPLHILLPQGELWFCRVFNRVLPEITDPQLYADVKGFIGQEAVHSRSHSNVIEFYKQHGIDLTSFVRLTEVLFKDLVDELPLKQRWLAKLLGKNWLIFQVGAIAAIEHFTSILGMWVLEEKALNNFDPEILRLIRWHGAEEVEHRSVAFDLFQHLCKSKLGFYVGRQFTMSLIFPLFVVLWTRAVRFTIEQDPNIAKGQFPTSMFGILRAMEKEFEQSARLPSVKYIVKSVGSWMKPSYDPRKEGNDQLAAYYFKAYNF